MPFHLLVTKPKLLDTKLNLLATCAGIVRILYSAFSPTTMGTGGASIYGRNFLPQTGYICMYVHTCYILAQAAPPFMAATFRTKISSSNMIPLASSPWVQGLGFRVQVVHSQNTPSLPPWVCRLSLCLPLSLSLCLSVCLSVCLCVCCVYITILSVWLCVCYVFAVCILQIMISPA